VVALGAGLELVDRPVDVAADASAGTGPTGPAPTPAPTSTTATTTTSAPTSTTPPLPATVPAPTGVITALPGQGNLLALTIDDGTSSEVVAAYTQFCADSGVRLTFFVNGVYRSWTDNAPALRPLVDSGQVLLANHTWSHPDVTTISSSALTDQITRNDAFLRSTYGAAPEPFFRPPYGHHNARTDRVAADLGHPTITLWEGSLSDSSVITEDFLLGQARLWFKPQHIVIGHANHPAVTHTYPQLLDIIHERALRTVTLADVFRAAP
jgi:peptidoglycan/xylan/chitin deacetylase (PgdA/CDA1 family)